MSFGNYKQISEIANKYMLSYRNVPDLFPGIAPVEPGPVLSFYLGKPAETALVLRTEAALREAIIGPFLQEAITRATQPTILYTGVTFNVAPGLSGVPDYLVGRGEHPGMMQAPLLAVIVTKRDDFTEDAGQCAAAMVAIREFNAVRSVTRPVFGCVTNGSEWFTYQLDGDELTETTRPLPMIQADRILGVLVSIMSRV